MIDFSSRTVDPTTKEMLPLTRHDQSRQARLGFVRAGLFHGRVLFLNSKVSATVRW